MYVNRKNRILIGKYTKQVAPLLEALPMNLHLCSKTKIFGVGGHNIVSKFQLPFAFRGLKGCGKTKYVFFSPKDDFIP